MMDQSNRYQMICRFAQREKELDRVAHPTQEQVGESIAIGDILYLLRHVDPVTWKGEVEQKILTWPTVCRGHDASGQSYEALKRAYDKTLGDWIWEVLHGPEEEVA